VKGIHYHCSSLDEDEAPAPRHDRGYPERLRAKVRKNALRWLDDEVTKLWPGAQTPAGKFDWSLLHDWDGTAGEARFDAQHHCAIVHPSDRYVRSHPGSVATRLRGWESGYDNVILAGDWTKNSMSVGCLESATASGIEAARCLDPRVERSSYDWLPDRDPTNPGGGGGAPGVKRKYIVRTGEMLVPPPVKLVTRLSSFFVRADYARLEELCASHLNLDPSLRYRPAGEFVVFYCSNMQHDTAAGSIDELDFGVWVPVFATNESGTAVRALTYTPFLWVTDSPSLVGGRAIYGFPKHLADNTLPVVGAPARFTVVPSVVIKDRAEKGPLVTIARKSGGLWQGNQGAWGMHEIKEALTVLGLVHPIAVQPELIADLLLPGGGMPTVFLKQFPDVNGSWDACYQAITETEIEVLGEPKGGPLDGDYEVEILRCRSHAIVDLLGLRNADGPPRTRFDAQGRSFDVLDVVLDGWMEFTAEVQPGQVKWCSIGA
jgi:hypothetical protein